MATQPGLFYAYVKHNADEWSGRFLITFASRAVADEWWRAITNSILRGHTRFNHVVRHSMHFYSCDWKSAHLYETLTDVEVVRGTSLMNQIFFTRLDDRDGRTISPAPIVNYRDHRSGDEFFIRSMLQPEVFWFYDSQADLIRPSKNRRTRFTISVVDPKRRLGPNPIMISTDPISITVDVNIVSLDPEEDEAEPWAKTKRAHKEVKIISELQFCDFDDGFEIMFSNDSEEFKGATIVPTTDGKGERWELV